MSTLASPHAHPVARRAAIAALCIGLLTVPLVASSSTIYFAATTLVYVGLALSLDLVWGYLGILSLGHAAFFGAGAYLVALGTRSGWPPDVLLLLPLAVAVGAALGGLIGAFLFAGRRSMTVIYVAIATLAISFVAERTVRGWQWAGADTGLSGVPSPQLLGLVLGGPAGRYWLGLGFSTCAFLLTRALIRSDLRILFAGFRSNEQRLRFLGYRTSRTKITVFAISGGLAAASGALYGLTVGFVSPTSLGIGLSTIAMIWVLAGGAGTLYGPVMGVILVEFGARALSNRWLGWWQVLLGIVLLLVVLFLRNGLAGMLRGEAVVDLPAESTVR